MSMTGNIGFSTTVVLVTNIDRGSHSRSFRSRISTGGGSAAKLRPAVRFKTIRGARKCRAVMEFTLAFAMFAADYHRAAESGRSTEFSSPRACVPRASVTTYSKSGLVPRLPGKRRRMNTVHGEHFV